MQKGVIEGPVENPGYKSRQYRKPERVSELIYEEVTDDQERRNGRQEISPVSCIQVFICGI